MPVGPDRLALEKAVLQEGLNPTLLETNYLKLLLGNNELPQIGPDFCWLLPCVEGDFAKQLNSLIDFLEINNPEDLHKLLDLIVQQVREQFDIKQSGVLAQCFGGIIEVKNRRLGDKNPSI